MEKIDGQNQFSYKDLLEISEYLLDRVTIRPKIGIICGSGLGPMAEAVEKATVFDYEDIPNFPKSTVLGHEGKLIFGLIANIPIICMQGRFHFYEGYSLKNCAMPVRVMKLIGITHLILSNAAGGINSNYKIGDVMIIKDHINFMGLSGNNPLQGPNNDKFGPRFIPMNKAYDDDLVKQAKIIGHELGMDGILHEGIYGCVGGPNFETVAECRMLKILGVDSVGMSTVPEVITARHCDIKIFGFSLITNKSITDYGTNQQPNHEEVIEVAKERQGILKLFVKALIKYIGSNQS